VARWRRSIGPGVIHTDDERIASRIGPRAAGGWRGHPRGHLRTLKDRIALKIDTWSASSVASRPKPYLRYINQLIIENIKNHS
jgi:hypothetical protein